MLIIMYLQGLLEKAAKSGRKWFVINFSMGDMWPPLLQCYNVTMLHVTCYVKEFALRPSASRREGGEGRGGLGRRAGGRQEWPWQEGD